VHPATKIPKVEEYIKEFGMVSNRIRHINKIVWMQMVNRLFCFNFANEDELLRSSMYVNGARQNTRNTVKIKRRRISNAGDSTGCARVANRLDAIAIDVYMITQDK